MRAPEFAEFMGLPDTMAPRDPPLKRACELFSNCGRLAGVVVGYDGYKPRQEFAQQYWPDGWRDGRIAARVVLGASVEALVQFPAMYFAESDQPHAASVTRTYTLAARNTMYPTPPGTEDYNADTDGDLWKHIAEDYAASSSSVPAELVTVRNRVSVLRWTGKGSLCEPEYFGQLTDRRRQLSHIRVVSRAFAETMQNMFGDQFGFWCYGQPEADWLHDVMRRPGNRPMPAQQMPIVPQLQVVT